MALYFIKDTTLSGIANAIRAKTGATGAISVADMATEISSIAAGGGGGSDDSCIEWEAIMPATDITFANGGEFISFELVYPLILNGAYKVKWGDDEYIGTAVETVFNGMDCVAIGNVGALEGNPDDCPFVIGYIPSANGFGIMRMDGADTTQNVSISKAKAFGAIIQPLEITENGTYAAPEGVDGYSPVTVNVAASGGGDIVSIVDFGTETGFFNTTQEWVLTSAGELIIYTLGSYSYMSQSYSETVRPGWEKHKDKIKAVTICGVIMSVGTYAFYNYTNLTAVTLPNHITQLNAYAFYGCSSLTTITIPYSVNSIAHDAFTNSGLTSATFLYKTGWKVQAPSSTSSTSISVDSTTTSATYLKSTHSSKNWFR